MVLNELTKVLRTFAAKVVYEAKFNAQKNALSGKLLNSINTPANLYSSLFKLWLTFFNSLISFLSR